MGQYKVSRLARKQEIRSLRKAVLFFLLTIILLLTLFFLGIPFLIKMAIFIGNIRSSYLPNEEESTIPPPPPKFKQTFEATNSAIASLKGYAEPDSIIEINVGEIPQMKTTTKSDGSFTVESFTLTLGRNQITATATNKSGKTSAPSEPIIIEYDNTLPKLTILEPTNNSVFYGTNNRIVIKGETDENATITVNEKLVIVGPNGKFNHSIVLVLGENKIKILAVDKAGNQKEEELILRLE